MHRQWISKCYFITSTEFYVVKQASKVIVELPGYMPINFVILYNYIPQSSHYL